MQRPEITELFRYFSKIEFALDVLETKRVFCSRAQSFNDPFDGSISFEVDLDPAEFIASAHRTYQKQGHNWEGIKSILDAHVLPDGTLTDATKSTIKSTAEKYRESNKNAGILCLSEDPLSVLMWSHYANKHQGVCIGFTRSETNDLGDDDACNPIVYSDVYPKPRFSQLYRKDGALTEELLFTKARDWAYEKEWRMMSDKGDFHAKIPGPVSRVILGCRFEDGQLNRIKESCGSNKVPLFRAHQIPHHFALELRPE